MSNVKQVKYGKTERRSFGKINEIMEMPNLIKVQKDSYESFRKDGLREVIRDLEPITDYSNKLELSFVDYELSDEPIHSVKECKERQISYSSKMTVRARLLNKDTGEIKESDVYLGEFPLMTESGTFVINGAERVIVSQLVRSPGVYYGETHNQFGKKLFSTTVIPNRGAWIEYETDPNDIFFVRIDKNRKMPVTTFIRALDVFLEETGSEIRLNTDEKILEFFDHDDRIKTTLEKDQIKDSIEAIFEVYRKLRPGEPPTKSSAEDTLSKLFFDEHRYDISRVGRYKYNKKLGISSRIRGFKLARDIIAEGNTGEILAKEGEIVTKDRAIEIENGGAKIAYVYVEGEDEPVKVISNNMVDIFSYIPADLGITREDLEFYGISEKVSWPVLLEIMPEFDGKNKEELLKFLESKSSSLIPRHITIDDILSTINYLCSLAHGVGNADDIDHLGNRRIRSVGELLQNQFRIGFARMDRVIRERMTLQVSDIENVTIQGLINTRPIGAAVREFFGSSPLSQFMDQNNPLSELTHKRRLSALGPGGLSRDRAGFEVRDVHYTHYGRMCPIETPEGPNIGLISYLATYAKINKYGFIEAPYRKIKKTIDDNGKTVCEVTDEVVYMTADTEDEYVVVQGNEPLDENNHFIRRKVNARYRDEFREMDPSGADFMDVSPKMVVSVATALIPFLENDDANRALMGSNMQKQAVPLLTCDSPMVGTGMEYKAATDSGVCVLAKNDGKVIYVSADRVDILESDNHVESYSLIKFMRSNQGTCVNQRPIVTKGEKIKKGQVIADGPATCGGELSLGKNALIGFMTWEGYNYEDAVLINEKLVRDDVYTSIHIERYDIDARDTKLGPETITREIPNVGADALKNLDENGIIRVGAEVKSGDILVGKISPKGETEETAEERLLKAVFGNKTKEVRDASLRVPHGEYGIIVNVEIFTREDCNELGPGVNKTVRCYIAQKRKIQVGDKMAGRHGNKGVVSRVLPCEDMPFLADGTPLDIVLNPLGVPSRMNIGQVLEVHLGFACRENGYKIETPVFDGAHEDDIKAALIEAANTENGKAIGIKENGKVWLTDGRTGEKFDQEVTVGVMYYLKLHHLVDDKMHARSIGPYSLVTQQPLGGKAQFGGQRFGEMEVWALEAYGAAYTLQEILTIKSDDVNGRDKTYEAIVKGENVPSAGVPESFKVLVKELQSLGLDIKVFDSDKEEIDLKLKIFDDNQQKYPYKADSTDLSALKDEILSDDDDDLDLDFDDLDDIDLDDDDLDLDSITDEDLLVLDDDDFVDDPILSKVTEAAINHDSDEPSSSELNVVEELSDEDEILDADELNDID